MNAAPGARRKKAEPKGLKACGLRVLAGVKKVWLALLWPSLHSYFFWSFSVFAACGIVVLLGIGPQYQFFCAVAPQGQYNGMGCENCTSKLLMCEKPDCWRTAMNITYQANASSAAKSLYQNFRTAISEKACNQAVEAGEVTDPVQMIGMINQDIAAYSSDCKKFHCGVFKNAVRIFSDLSSPTGVCTNIYGAKPPALATTCVCESLVTHRRFDDFELSDLTPTSSAMTAINDVCGKQYIRDLEAMCTTWHTVYPKWCQATTITSTTTTTTTVTTTTTTAAPAARRLQDAEGETSAWSQPNESGCFPSSGAAAEEVALWLQPPTEGQRHALREGQLQPPTDVQLDQDLRPLSAPSEARRLQAAPTPAPTVANDKLPDYEVGDWSRCTCYQQCIPGVRTRNVECLSASCKAPEPADREPCICNPCAACIMTMRLIVLMAIFFTQAFLSLIVFLLYLKTTSHTEDDFIQIGILKKLNGFFYKQLPGLIRLLVLAQLFQVIWFLFDVWVASFAKKYLGGYQRDCFASKDLRTVSAVAGGLWLFQVVLGKCAKSHTRKPDWLYVPERPSWAFPIKQIRMLLRSLGP